MISLISNQSEATPMSSLIVRNIAPDIVTKLKQRAAKHARSAEAEHRAILEAALCKTERRSLADVLASMPDVGLDTDFERGDDADVSHVFD